MVVSLEATTSRKISGQVYLVLGFGGVLGEEGTEVEEGDCEQARDWRARRRIWRMEARSRRKTASRPTYNE